MVDENSNTTNSRWLGCVRQEWTVTHTILIIDDDQAVHNMVDEHLRADDMRVLHTCSPMEGIQLAAVELPDVVLLDVNMPGMDGLKVCRHLKEAETTRDIPIIFLTVNRDAKQIARALDCGGSDYIHKPFEQVELQARVRATLRTKRMLDLLKVQARIDGLTGLKNRAALDDALEASMSAFQRMDAPMSLLMLDVDHFKEINDQHGHGVGDEVLRHIGEVISATCRPYDTACRFGGDEFTVIFGQTLASQSELAAKRMMAAIVGQPVRAEKYELNIKLSGGLVSVENLPDEATVADLVKAADSALYEAKRSGRGRLVIHE